MGAAGVCGYSVRTAKSAIIALIKKISKQENFAFHGQDRLYCSSCGKLMSVLGAFLVYFNPFYDFTIADRNADCKWDGPW
jgi:hypothetical protein